MIGEMAESKRRGGCKWDCKELEISQKNHGQLYKGGKLLQIKPRLSSVNNGLIARLWMHHNQSENKTWSWGETGEIFVGRVTLHGNVILNVLKLFVNSDWGTQMVSLSFFPFFLARRQGERKPEGGSVISSSFIFYLFFAFVWDLGYSALNPSSFSKDQTSQKCPNRWA